MARDVPCASCPFRDPLQFAGLSSRADAGEWIPCVLTAGHNPPAEIYDTPYARKIESWRQESECVGARLWRRDRAKPQAVSFDHLSDEERLAAALRSS